MLKDKRSKAFLIIIAFALLLTLILILFVKGEIWIAGTPFATSGLLSQFLCGNNSDTLKLYDVQEGATSILQVFNSSHQNYKNYTGLDFDGNNTNDGFQGCVWNGSRLWIAKATTESKGVGYMDLGVDISIKHMLLTTSRGVYGMMGDIINNPPTFFWIRYDNCSASKYNADFSLQLDSKNICIIAGESLSSAALSGGMGTNGTDFFLGRETSGSDDAWIFHLDASWNNLTDGFGVIQSRDFYVNLNNTIFNERADGVHPYYYPTRWIVNLSIMPNSTNTLPYSNTSLNCSVQIQNLIDPAATVLINVTWLNGTAYYNSSTFTVATLSAQGYANVSLTLGQGQTNPNPQHSNEAWNCSANFTDTTNSGDSAFVSQYIGIANSKPTIINVTNSSITAGTNGKSAYKNSTLNCSFTVTDIDEEGANALKVNVTWYNGTTYVNSSTLLVTNGTQKSFYLNYTTTPQHKGETWNCSLNATDGIDSSVYNSTIFTILNTPPDNSTWFVANLSKFSTGTNNVYLNWRGDGYGVGDLDNDTISFQLEILDTQGVSGTVSNTSYSGATATLTLASGNYSAKLKTYDGETYSIPAALINFTVDTVPEIRNVTILPNSTTLLGRPYKNSTLNCSFQVYDAEKNAFKVNITWRNGTQYINSSTLSIASASFSANGYVNLSLPLNVSDAIGIQHKGETWNCSINATDILDGLFNSTTMNIYNSVPDNVTIITANNTVYGVGEAQNVNWTGGINGGSDGVGDLDNDTLTYNIEIYSTEILTLVSLEINTTTASNYTASLVPGDYWYRIKTYDGTAYSVPSDIQNFTVNIPISAPTLYYNNTNLSTTIPTFNWSKSSATATYSLEIYNSSVLSATTLVLNKSWITQNYTLTALENLNSNRYYWRVKANQSDSDMSRWSSNFSFIIDSLSPNIYINTPASNEYISAPTAYPSEITVNYSITHSIIKSWITNVSNVTWNVTNATGSGGIYLVASGVIDVSNVSEINTNNTFKFSIYDQSYYNITFYANQSTDLSTMKSIRIKVGTPLEDRGSGGGGGGGGGSSVINLITQQIVNETNISRCGNGMCEDVSGENQFTCFEDCKVDISNIWTQSWFLKVAIGSLIAILLISILFQKQVTQASKRFSFKLRGRK